MLLDVDSGETALLADGQDPSWSPDGSQVAFISEGNLHITGSDGANRVQVTNPTQPYVTKPEWLPNGSLLFVFAPPLPAVFSIAPEGGTELNLADGYGPVWSPDGTEIAFVGGGTGGGLGGRSDIHIMRNDGTGLRKVGDYTWDDVGGPCERSTYAWSPEGNLLAYDREGRISVVNSETGAEEFTIPSGYGPAWSPDGERLAYAAIHSVINSPVGCQIIISSDGDMSALAQGESPHWSPDGQLLAFTETMYPLSSVAVIGADGADKRELTVDECGAAECSIVFESWSPDGSKILIVAFRFNPETQSSSMGQVRTWDVQTGASTLIADGIMADWSPDGQYVVFQTGGYDYDSQLWVTKADGTGKPQFLADGYGAQWSPDGTRITFTR
jgi:TolB protein